MFWCLLPPPQTPLSFFWCFELSTQPLPGEVLQLMIVWWDSLPCLLMQLSPSVGPKDEKELKCRHCLLLSFLLKPIYVYLYEINSLIQWTIIPPLLIKQNVYNFIYTFPAPLNHSLNDKRLWISDETVKAMAVYLCNIKYLKEDIMYLNSFEPCNHGTPSNTYASQLTSIKRRKKVYGGMKEEERKDLQINGIKACV